MQSIFLGIYICLLFNFQPKEQSPIGKRISNFSLTGINHQKISLSDYPDAKGFIIVFTCNHCPFAKLYTNRLNALYNKYKLSGLPLLAINSMDTLVYDHENLDAMRNRAKSEKYHFPYLQDASQTVAKDFKAQRTPQAFILWKEESEWVVKYSGAIDDNGKEPSKATPYLENAIQALLHNQKITTAETESIGCVIHYRK